MKLRKTILILLVAVLGSMEARAQFNSLGTEKASTRWNTVKSQNYQVIFPVQADSLGRVYAALLEQYRPWVGNSAGFLPNERYRRPMPVILHPFTGFSNGAVTWAPRRMVLFTFADSYGMLPPVPWEKILAIHENRHVAQMQIGQSGFWKPFHYPFGQLPAQMVGGFLPNAAILEGDAVVAETALTSSGRGRSGDFLAYIRMAFDNGDTRNWMRWRYGSQKHYTPDYYRIGYMTVAGMRTEYGAPMFMSDYLHRLTKPLCFSALPKTMKSYSGKSMKQTWNGIAEAFHTGWKEDDVRRGPFQELQPLMRETRRYFTATTNAVQTADGRVFAIRAGLADAEELVEILPDGTVESIRPTGAESRLVYSPRTDCLYWSEMAVNARWDLQQDNRIKKMKVGEKKIYDVTHEGRFVSPGISEDGRYLAAPEYPIAGGSRIVLFDLDTEEEIRSIAAPGGLQVTEVAFCGDDLLFTGVSDNGMGLYRTDFASITVLEPAVPAQISGMISRGGVVYFTSNRNGTREIYSYAGGKMTQLTNTKYGVSSPFFRDGKLCFAALQPEGRILSTVEKTLDLPVAFSDVAAWPIADKLAAQERAIAAQKPMAQAPGLPATERYKKAANFLHVHSWAPVYSEEDDLGVTDASYDYQSASAGALVYFQNLTGTASGTLGLSIHENPLNEDEISTGLHARLTYSGLLPVIEAGLDIGDRPSVSVTRGLISETDSTFRRTLEREGGSPVYIGGRLSVSLPLDFSSHGWNRSFAPYFSIKGSTDDLGESYMLYDYQPGLGYIPQLNTGGSRINMLFYQAGFSASVALPTAPAASYPRLGAGLSARYSANACNHSLYAGVHGFLPGLAACHGLKLAAAVQTKGADPTSGAMPLGFWLSGMVDMAPRGFEDTMTGSQINLAGDYAACLSADYTMPLASLDWSLGYLAYLRNLDLTPFCDVTFTDAAGSGTGNLYSAGADLGFRFEKILMLNSPLKVALRVAYNGGSLMKYFPIKDEFYIGFKTNLSL